MAITLYGIPNCDTMKKARVWLDQAKIAYVFHDYKKQGIDAKTLTAWARKVGWEVLLNKAGTTFRGLSDAQKANIDEKKAIALMLEMPGMIKRPVLDKDGAIHVGFKPDAYAQIFKK